MESAIVGLASLVNETPWLLEPSDFERASAAGLSDDALLHVVLQTAFFNHLNRVADAVGIEFDYATELPPMAREDRDPVPRPDRDAWPLPREEPRRLLLAQRPSSAEAFARWRAHNLEREAPLSLRERRVIVLAVASALCDAVTVGDVSDATPRNARERRFAEYATMLTHAPWRMTDGALDPLRGEGLDDVGLLDVIAVASFQNTASRIQLALSAS